MGVGERRSGGRNKRFSWVEKRNEANRPESFISDISMPIDQIFFPSESSS